MDYTKFLKMRELFAHDELGKYKHFKGGVYEVMDLAFHTETEEPMVVYQDADGIVFVRPYHKFFSTVDGSQRRFTKIK